MLKMTGYDFFDLEEIDDTADVFMEKIKDDFYVGKTELEDTIYEVELQGNRFRCVYSDDEMENLIKTCVKIMNELINIANSGYTKAQFKTKSGPNAKGESETLDSFWDMNETYMDFASTNLKSQVEELSRITRVGGAYNLLISKPIIINVIYAVFNLMLDDPEDEHLWGMCLYFLIRGAMRMHSDEAMETN